MLQKPYKTMPLRGKFGNYVFEESIGKAIIYEESEIAIARMHGRAYGIILCTSKGIYLLEALTSDIRTAIIDSSQAPRIALAANGEVVVTVFKEPPQDDEKYINVGTISFTLDINHSVRVLSSVIEWMLLSAGSSIADWSDYI